MPWSALAQLFSPLSYLRIRHPLKVWFDWVVPATVAAACIAIVIVLPKPLPILGDDGLITVITGLLQILVGFYIAALAAIATFQREGLDNLLSGDPAQLNVVRNGVPRTMLLSRRRFLCYLFGYLAFSGLALYFIGASANLLSANLQALIPTGWASLAKYVSAGLYLFWTANVLVTTLLGLHYLTDRIHRD